MKPCDRPEGFAYPELLLIDAALVHQISGLVLEAKSSKNNMLKIRLGNHNMQNHLSKLCLEPKANSGTVRQREGEGERGKKIC